MTEPQPYVSLDSQQFNLNLTKPKPNFTPAERSRHSFSVAETKFETKNTKYTPVGLDSTITTEINRDSFVSLE